MDPTFLTIGAEDRRLPHYKRDTDTALVGYTGFTGSASKSEFDRHNHELDAHNEKYMIRGYTVIGEPSIPEQSRQPYLRKLRSPTENLLHTPNGSGSKPESSDAYQGRGGLTVDTNEGGAAGAAATSAFAFRTFAKHMDMIERYSTAVQQLLDRGQTQEMLLSIVQAKFSERVNSYAAQLTRTRKIFEAYDINKDGVLDEKEFRICLEKLNIQFDDVQSLALFAFFDHQNSGVIEWEAFADHAMVFNPKGGTAVLPKMITKVAANTPRAGLPIHGNANSAYHHHGKICGGGQHK